MSNRVIPNLQTASRFNIAGFDTLDSSGGSGDEGPANKQQQTKQKAGKPGAGGGGQSASAKKRARKKKAKQQQESAELRNMAFSKLASVPRARTQSGSSDGANVGGMSQVSTENQRSRQQAGSKTNRPPEQWEQWKVQDQGFVDTQYERDLQKAILQSKLEHEQQKLFYEEIGEYTNRPDSSLPAVHAPQSPKKHLPEQTGINENTLYHLPGHKQSTSIYQKLDQLEDFDTLPEEPEPAMLPMDPNLVGSKKEKNKHSKAKNRMSLQEFQTGGNNENGVSHQSADPVSLPKKSPSISEEDKDFFEKVDQDVAKILNKDHIKKARQKNEKLIAENARRIQYEDQLEQKDKVVAGLKDVIEKLKVELTQVKKRNKQLCFILAQGEMKDKADVLKQVEDLTNVKDELTAEVAELHGSLEQERSKVSSLKAELQKLQDRKK